MTKKLRLVMATNNAGKLREARAIAGDKLEILSLDDIGYHHDIPETADTLEGNALIKVRAIKKASGLDCFADDTGLMVDALDGAPGVYTARYAGPDCNPDDNIDLMLKNLDGVVDRKARFCTCIALSLEGKERIFSGIVEGSIATERSGSHGFGYDPIFVPDETGIPFAEMTDESKNAISHRGRAISAMMKWLGTLCIAMLSMISANAATATDWKIHNTFDDKIEHVFDTPSKTYFLVHAQNYDPTNVDNADKLCHLFCLDKETGEVRPYNALNFLSGTIISKAAYNAQKNYLFIVYDDKTIDFLYDNGDVYTMQDLKGYDTSYSKDVRSISFDSGNDRVYITTGFGFMAINEKKHEIAFSGIYGTPIDAMTRICDKLIILYDGKIYWDDASSYHNSISDFTELNWKEGSSATDLITLSDSRCIISREVNGDMNHYVVSWPADSPAPYAEVSGNYKGSTNVENRDGVLFDFPNEYIHIDRETGKRTWIGKRAYDVNSVGGSWDLKDFQIAMPRKGFYSLRRDGDDWIQTSESVRPNAPAAFRCDDLLWTKEYGMLANTHGFNKNFQSTFAMNPILLSGLKGGFWDMYGLPYVSSDNERRLINPCGIAQDPDNPDIFYFGSLPYGMIRYNIKDGSSLLHFTKSNDTPDLPGHVSVIDQYPSWRSRMVLLNPRFDKNGNLILAHINTEDGINPEIWIWTPEDRRATISPESFRPFIRLKVNGLDPREVNLALPLMTGGNSNRVIFFPFDRANASFVVYDHNGTPADTIDDRQGLMSSLFDSDGTVSYDYLYCAVEDPATGLVWVGSNNGVFTFDPNDAFTNPGKVSRIKVSRNDGTSLADYLLAGSSVNNIAIDGQGRKWFSLNGGGLVCTTADGKTIIQELNSDNSGLPSDLVYTSCYNPDNNSLMVATSAGLCEYYLSGQATQGETSSVRAYPNPVRHDYYGWVTIDGLEDDCVVKIADSAGNIVRELGPASAGRVQWDVCGLDLNRVPSGVYFVLASSGGNEGKYSEVSKILVINR